MSDRCPLGYLFLILAQNVECGYALEPPHAVVIEAVLVSYYNLCLDQNEKNNVYPCKPQFYYIKVGRTLQGHVSMMYLKFQIKKIDILSRVPKHRCIPAL